MAFTGKLVNGTIPADQSLDPATYPAEHVITRDVAVLGGGSSGTYAAVRLQDHNKSFVVIERSHRLGGHAETYSDPETGSTLDIGVIVWGHLEQVKKYFARFDVPLKEMRTDPGSPDFVDTVTGQPIEYELPKTEAVGEALKKYGELLYRFPKIQAGYYLDYPIDEDLLLPFGEFVEKYNLQALVPAAFTICQGYSPLLEISTIYVFKYLNADLLNTLSTSFLTTARSNAQEIYVKAAAHIGSTNIIYNANIVAMHRDDAAGPVRILVDTSKGRRLILARKLLSSAPPLIDNLQGWDLDSTERQLFSQYFYNAYYSCIVRTEGLKGASVMYRADPSRPCEIPELPGIYTINPHPVANLVQIYYGSPRPLKVETVKRDILDTLQKIIKVRGIDVPEPQIVAFASHTPYNMMVPNQAIRDGFYKKLYALQGQRHTYHNGSAFHAQDSSVLWRFNDEEILPRLLKDLDEAK